MKTKIITMVILSIFLLLSIPSIQAVEHQTVKESIIEKIQQLKDIEDPVDPLIFILAIIGMIIGCIGIFVGICFKILCIILNSDIPLPFIDSLDD